MNCHHCQTQGPIPARRIILCGSQKHMIVLKKKKNTYATLCRHL